MVRDALPTDGRCMVDACKCIKRISQMQTLKFDFRSKFGREALSVGCLLRVMQGAQADEEALQDDEERDEMPSDQTAVLATCWKNQTFAALRLLGRWTKARG